MIAMFRRQYSLGFTAAALLGVLVGCSSPAHGPDEKYFLITTNTKVSYWQSALAGLSKAAAQMKGIRTEMVGPDTYDPKAEHDEFQATLGKKPAGILVSVSDPKII